MIQAKNAVQQMAPWVRRLRENRFPEAKDYVRPVFYAGVQYNFDTKQTPEGVAWKPRKDNKPHPLLDLTGAMKAAATGGRGAMLTWTRTSVIFKLMLSVIDYAAYQNRGTKNKDGSVRIPARKYYGINEVYRRMMGDSLRRMILVMMRSQN